ncbi:MAG: cytochrome c family protein [Deltaproteobacteria bacterium]|nr:cytochrome c family protein [Deltaproteobacteria bacterium]
MTARAAILLALATLYGALAASPSPAQPAGAGPAPRTSPRPAAPAAEAAPAPAKLAMRPRKAAHGGFVDDMDCSACHTPAGWQLASTAGSSGFDHDRTGFPLRGAHNQSSCGKCHTSKGAPATTCEGCHRDPHQGRNDGTCAECHTATAWADTNTLEQHRRTRMPLTGRHATLDCTACHTRQGERGFSDVPSDCFACHRAAFQDPHTQKIHATAGASSRLCGGCHTTTNWTTAFTDPNTLVRTAMARTGEHDAYFVLTSGSHRTTECSACHTDARRTKLVRCDGCHQDVAVRRQHKTAIARTPSACLRCHPRGAAR